MPKEQPTAVGTAQIDINNAATVAHLTFVRDADSGKEWDLRRLLEHIKSCGIVHGVLREQLEREWRSFLPSSRDRLELHVARATVPTEPTPETIVWDEKPLPEDIAELARELAGKAKPPTITVTRYKKVKRTKKVTKKAKLPFMKPSEETVETTANEPYEERVYVDTTVDSLGYADAGDRIAEIEPASAGSPGQNVRGETIPVQPLADPHAYAGSGVTRKKSELVAEITGIIRRGPNWADMLEFEVHDWSVSVSEDRGTCFLSFDPGHSSAEPPTVAEIKEAAREQGFDVEQLVSDSELREIIQGSVREDRRLEQVPITIDQDAAIEVEISEDKLRAVLHLRKGRGSGKPLVLKEIGAAIKEHRFSGLDKQKVSADIKEFYQSDRQELQDYVLVEGKAAKPGPERNLEYSVRFLSDEATAIVRERAKERRSAARSLVSLDAFPFDAVQSSALVQQDQRVVAISPAAEGESGIDVYGNIIPGRAADEPTLHLFEFLQRKGNFIISTLTGILERRVEEDGATLLRVRYHRDAEASISVSSDKLTARLTIISAEGSGELVTRETLDALLEHRKISYGLIEEALEAAVRRSSDGEDVEELVIARGKPPRAGGPQELEFRVELASGSDVKIRPDGTADYRSHDRITTVEKGTLIAEIAPSDEDVLDGTDIHGNTIPGEKGKTLPLDVGENVRREVDENNGVKLYAEADGELRYENERLWIHPAHLVKGDVDMQAGNIKFPGPVVVGGSVRAGFYIMAAGEVQIGEAIEASLVSSDENVLVKQGIKGGRKGVIRSKKNIGLAFAEQATLLAVGEIQITRSALHCDIKCNGRLRITEDKGSLIGGTTRARKGIEVANLGSSKGTQTRVSFGQDYLIQDQIEKQSAQLEKMQRRVATLDGEMRVAEKEGDRKRLESLRREKVKLLKTVEKLGLRVFNLQEKFEAHYPGEIRVRGTIHPGVVLESHGRTLEISSEKKKVIFSFDPDSGQIVEEPLAKDG